MTIKKEGYDKNKQKHIRTETPGDVVLTDTEYNTLVEVLLSIKEYAYWGTLAAIFGAMLLAGLFVLAIFS